MYMQQNKIKEVNEILYSYRKGAQQTVHYGARNKGELYYLYPEP